MTDRDQENMLIEAICTNLNDLLSDVAGEESESTLSIVPQVRDIKRMADKLRDRMSKRIINVILCDGCWHKVMEQAEAIQPVDISREDIDRMKRDGYLGTGWAR